jgi:hypothetical protein
VRRARADYEPTDPTPSAPDPRWATLGTGLHLAAGSTDRRYARDRVPETEGDTLRLSGWRGERVSAQAVLFSAADASQLRLTLSSLTDGAGHRLPGDAICARFVRFVRADGRLVGDILDDATRIDADANTTRPIWISVEVPRSAVPGTYRGTLTVLASGHTPVSLSIAVEALAPVLPAPKDWAFYLDLWQNPYALARYHRVPVWSAEHFARLKPHLRLLADAGQKVLTTTLLHAPWGGQTYDSYDSMIGWARMADGRWKWDYSAFDRYVAFGRSCGIGPWIHCYSMIPWTNRLRYLDAATGNYAWIDLKPGDPSYEAVFGPFLEDFQRHLKAKGWLGVTRIAMDERPLPVTQAARAVLARHAPKIPVALAGDGNPAFSQLIDDWCIALSDVDPALLQGRAAQGKPTTFYVCCNPQKPNTFVFSPPAEAHWIGLWAAARGYSGFLRWAFDSWTEDPLYETKHVTWDAGDCFLIYPGPRSSIRFERLRDGIEDYEKLRWLRQRGADLHAVDAALAALSIEKVQNEPAAPQVNAVRRALDAVSRAQ